jgi:hypothetical protein
VINVKITKENRTSHANRSGHPGPWLVAAFDLVLTPTRTAA